MGIIAIVITMFSNVLVSSLRTSIKIAARSSIREELSSIGSLIRKDIRTAEEFVNCGETSAAADLTQCTLQVNNLQVQWRRCVSDATKVCKLENGIVVYESARIMNLTLLEFAPGIESDPNSKQRNVLLTIAADYRNTAMGIRNLIYQTNLSSRNYTIIKLN
jgi:hypothetical protein